MSRVRMMVAVFLIFVVFLGAIYEMGRDHASTAAELEQERRLRLTAQAALARAQEAAAVHRVHLERADEERRSLQSTLDELKRMEGRDAPLSPVLRATAERLFAK